MELTLSNLQQAGAFTGAPVRQEIKWLNADGEELEAFVYVRRLSYHTLTEGYKAAAAADADPLAARIASCICDAEGRPVLTAGDVNGAADPERGPLCAALTEALLAVIGRVNGMGKKKPTRKNSGMS